MNAANADFTYTPNLEELRHWLEKQVAALELVELVAGVIALIARMRAINLELTKRVAHLTRKRPRSETLERLERLERQLVLPMMGVIATPVAKKNTGTDSAPPSDKKKRGRGGGRGAFPAHVPRVDETVACPNDDTIVSAPLPPAIVERGKLGDTLIPPKASAPAPSGPGPTRAG